MFGWEKEDLAVAIRLRELIHARPCDWDVVMNAEYRLGSETVSRVYSIAAVLHVMEDKMADRPKH